MRPSLIFLSYRRQDSGPFALALRSELELWLDGVPIFLDVSRIQGGDAWAKVLEDALTKATILLALIGPDWIGEAEGEPPRIQSEGDWVRREVARALAHPSDAVLPVLLNGADIPRRERLPEDLWKLFDAQAIPLRAESWDSDIENLCKILARKFSVRVKHADEKLPKRSIATQLEERLSDEALDKTREQGLLAGWEVEIIHDIRRTGFVREFLRKKFECTDPDKAVIFANEVMALSQRLDHHPIIEIMYQSVTIRLSTFDVGHLITTIDRRMAVGIDEAFARL